MIVSVVAERDRNSLSSRIVDIDPLQSLRRLVDDDSLEKQQVEITKCKDCKISISVDS